MKDYYALVLHIWKILYFASLYRHVRCFCLHQLHGITKWQVFLNSDLLYPFTKFYVTHSCEYVKWFLLQFMQEMSFVHVLLSWSNWPQREHFNVLRHVVWLWPNLWHLEHRNEFGTAGIQIISSLNRLWKGLVCWMIRSEYFSEYNYYPDKSWLILSTAVTPCGDMFSTIPSSLIPSRYFDMTNSLKHAVISWLVSETV